MLLSLTYPSPSCVAAYHHSGITVASQRHQSGIIVVLQRSYCKPPLVKIYLKVLRFHLSGVPLAKRNLGALGMVRNRAPGLLGTGQPKYPPARHSYIVDKRLHRINGTFFLFFFWDGGLTFPALSR